MEGVYGGIAFSVLTGFIMSFYSESGLIYIPNMPTIHFLVLSLLVFQRKQFLFILKQISITAIFGDFVESFVKRTANVKDSGTLFPGHGGMLDRVLIFVLIN